MNVYPICNFRTSQVISIFIRYVFQKKSSSFMQILYITELLTAIFNSITVEKDLEKN